MSENDWPEIPGHIPQITRITELRRGCAACGADARALFIQIGAFRPIIGVCSDCGHSWTIRRVSHAAQVLDGFMNWKAGNKI